jgi:hypothetical protein
LTVADLRRERALEIVRILPSLQKVILERGKEISKKQAWFHYLSLRSWARHALALRGEDGPLYPEGLLAPRPLLIETKDWLRVISGERSAFRDLKPEAVQLLLVDAFEEEDIPVRVRGLQELLKAKPLYMVCLSEGEVREVEDLILDRVEIRLAWHELSVLNRGWGPRRDKMGLPDQTLAVAASIRSADKELLGSVNSGSPAFWTIRSRVLWRIGGRQGGCLGRASLGGEAAVEPKLG